MQYTIRHSWKGTIRILANYLEVIRTRVFRVATPLLDSSFSYGLIEVFNTGIGASVFELQPVGFSVETTKTSSSRLILAAPRIYQTMEVESAINKALYDQTTVLVDATRMICFIPKKKQHMIWVSASKNI